MGHFLDININGVTYLLGRKNKEEIITIHEKKQYLVRNSRNMELKILKIALT